MTPDIERLLATAAGPPGGPPDLADVARRARRQRNARAAALVAACSAVALVAAGTALGGGRDAALHVVATTAPPLPSLSPAPTPSPSPEGTPAPTRTASPVPPPASAPPTTRVPAPEPTAFTDSGRGAYGLRADIEVRDRVVPAGSLVELTIESSDDDGHQYASFDWGDGTSLKGNHYGLMCQDVYHGPPPSSLPPAPGTSVRSHARAWRQPGQYVVRVTVVSDNPCNERTPREQVSFEVPVEITPGDSSGNGPDRPDGHHYVERLEDSETPTGVLELYSHDSDGYVARFVVDWGDGSRPQVLRNPKACSDGGGRHYPEGADLDIALTAEHEFPGEGPYEVTVTHVSTACDGSDPQQAASTATFDPPPP